MVSGVSHGHSSCVRGCGLCQTRPLQSPDKDFLPFGRQAHVIASVSLRWRQEGRRDTALQAAAFRIDVPSRLRGLRRASKSSVKRQAAVRAGDAVWPDVPAAKGRYLVPLYCTTARHPSDPKPGSTVDSFVFQEHMDEGQTSASVPSTAPLAEPGGAGIRLSVEESAGAAARTKPQSLV